MIAKPPNDLQPGALVTVNGRPGEIIHVYHGPVCDIITVKFDDSQIGAHMPSEIKIVRQATEAQDHVH
jgi:hypothetical protein